MKQWLMERVDELLPRLEVLGQRQEAEIQRLCEAEIAAWRARPTMRSLRSLNTPMIDARMEQLSRKGNQTQIFIETPYRNRAMLDTLVATCAPSTLICVAVDLTLPGETIVTRTASDWKKQSAPDLHKRPAIFLLLAS